MPSLHATQYEHFLSKPSIMMLSQISKIESESIWDIQGLNIIQTEQALFKRLSSAAIPFSYSALFMNNINRSNSPIPEFIEE